MNIACYKRPTSGQWEYELKIHRVCLGNHLAASRHFLVYMYERLGVENIQRNELNITKKYGKCNLGRTLAFEATAYLLSFI